MITPAEAQRLEGEMCAQLGIPPEAKKVIILSQSSHLDWDWLLPFPTLFNNVPPEQTGYFNPEADPRPASVIFSAAADFLCPGGEPNPLYYYSICEIGFLRAFAEQYPTQFAQLKAAGSNLRIVGGGITSPDNLLTHGEAFIRNYLLGKLWVDAHLGLPLTQAWLPDDFGHDPQLPVLLEALGLGGVGFQRVPMTAPPYPSNMNPLDGSPSIMQQLSKAGGADFVWRASDGSTTVAHWLQGGYCQGDGIDNGCKSCCENDNDCDTNYCIKCYYDTNVLASATRYIFVPVGCDFTRPRDLPAYAAKWNQTAAPDPGYESTGAYAVAATFDHYIKLLQLVNIYQPLNQRSFYAVPYMTGCYATRPLLKQEHYAATRALLGAEVFSVIAGGQSRSAALDSCWNDLAPSTHHDYITGTAYSVVYDGEQVPLLRRARAGSESLRQAAMSELAGAIGATPKDGEVPVVVCNQLGFARGGLVHLEPDIALSSLGLKAEGVRAGNSSPYGTLQCTADSGILFQATAPSLGYSTYYISQNQGNSGLDEVVSLLPQSGGSDKYVLANSFLSATISLTANWAVTELYDLKSSTPSVNILSGAANALVIYKDGGNNFRFGNEFGSDATDMLVPMPDNFTDPRVEVLETGPLLVRVRTRVTYVEPETQNAYLYTREYILHAGEPFLRMKTTGAAPFGGGPYGQSTGYSVMVEFPLQQDIQKLSHGTTYHWDDQPQVPYWNGPAFQATHDYVIACGVSAPLGAIYHGGVPAWGLCNVNGITNASDLLLGCLLRNTTGSYFDWTGLPEPSCGIDPEEHTLEYAFRVPTGIGDPASGVPLRESLAFQTPLMAAALPGQTTRSLPESFSLAEVSSDGANQPIITAAKFGSAAPESLILRVYQPTNGPLAVDLSLTGWASLRAATPGTDPPGPLQVQQVTALEAESDSPVEINALAEDSYSFTAARALTTIQVT